MSRDLPAYKEVSLERIAEELSTTNNLIRAYLTYVGKTAGAAEAMVGTNDNDGIMAAYGVIRDARKALLEAVKP